MDDFVVGKEQRIVVQRKKRSHPHADAPLVIVARRKFLFKVVEGFVGEGEFIAAPEKRQSLLVSAGLATIVETNFMQNIKKELWGFVWTLG